MKEGQHGAAVVMAMLVVALSVVLVSGAFYRQSAMARQVENAVAKSQADRLLEGAVDWARVILREDARTGGADHLGEPWAVPLAEARLSSFLAADRDNNSLAEGDDIEAFLSGSISDAQARWNLRKLVDAEGKVVPAQLRVLQRLCEQAGLPSDLADRIASALRKAWAPMTAEAGVAPGEAAIAPQRVADLAWLGIDADAIRRLEPWVVLLPGSDTRVNVNTAPAEVIAAAVEGMSLGSAQRLLQERQRSPLRDITGQSGRAYFPADPQTNLEGVGVSSRYFFVQGRLRLGDRVLEERSLIERRQLDIVVLSRDRVNLRDGG